ncbi:MAG: DUF2336 domain-containing protein [Alphaproteobacteria bacterium]|nr:MAG: DUF2336 domain-containing protein [Alphaproteobacteria bacterium]
MSDRNTALKTLLTLAEDPCPEKREKLLRALTDMYVRDADTLSPERIALYGEIFEVLAFSLPASARETLSLVMSKQDHAPANLIQLLARDTVKVAEPVLKYSPLLTERDLLQALQDGDARTAEAIAMRRDLTFGVTHALLSFKGTAPTIATNGFAQISYGDFRDLYDLSLTERSLQKSLLARVDLPPDIMNAMLFTIDPTHHMTILERTELLTDDDIDIALSMSDLQLTNRSHQDPGLVAQAKRHTAQLARDGRLDSAHLEELLRRGGGIEFTAALSDLARIGYAFTEELLKAPHATGIAILARALGLQKTTFSAILLLSNGGRKRSPEQVSAGMALFPKVSVRAANNVLRFWRHFSTPLEKVEAA